ncbi:translation initiation factor IF-2 [Patescibacteria group bacterium]|nr:translation initiation factor IF-2 [Patescibacteria group bacterium]
MEDNNQEVPKKPVALPPIVRVSELATILDKPVTEVIRYLLKNGVLASINDSIDFDTAAIVADDFGFAATASVGELGEATSEEEADQGERKERPPVVTVMGHVDHGKTSLLDYIRKTKVVEKESGGITQHIGSYQVEYKGKRITFLDTPGHEAFSAIRAQGTKVTDVVVLVVAADDGVKPQTIEAIDLAKAANVPMLVAVTKIDKPGADMEKVKQGLSSQQILTESWGGKVPLVGVSAKTGEGVDDLLELIALTSEVSELTANYSGRARGIIIEARRDPKIGQIATIIIKSGKFSIGDHFVAGGTYGKVKAMFDYLGRRIKDSFPSQPVSVAGFVGEPQIGAELIETDTEKEARNKAAESAVASARRITVTKSDLDVLAGQIRAQQVQNLNVVLKADVQGSLQAIRDQLTQIRTDRGGSIQIVSDGVGHIAESDILAAQGGNAFVVGFKVRILPGAAKMAEKDEVKLLTYDIIYELTADLKNLLLESTGLEKKETVEGEGTVLKVFFSTAKNKIVGCKVTKGMARKDLLLRVYRDDVVVGEGPIEKVQLVAQEVDEAKSGADYGFAVNINAKIKAGDRVEFVKVEYIKAKII